VHCRASAVHDLDPREFTTEEAFALIDNIVSFSDPVIILTGGEPMLRPDIYDIARYGTGKGLRMVLGTNGTFVTEETATHLKKVGIQRVTVSLDGSTAESHEDFRRVPGCFEKAISGLRALKKAGLSSQINTTITKRNLYDLENMLQTVRDLGVDAWHIFLLVPTGRGKEIEADEIPPEEYEKVLNWFYDVRKTVDINLKATCAPHYYRIMRQRAKEEGIKITPQTHGLDAMTRGCLGGITFCFISFLGRVAPCGYLPLDCGNVREDPFKQIWYECKIFNDLRDYSQLKGKCGYCEYKNVCGGCRARAYVATGDYMDEEPYCIYEPRKKVITEL
jgi:heme b synthase